MGRPPKYTAEQVAAAIRDSNGFVTVAAENLGCTLKTIYRYINKYRVCQQARDQAREKMTDYAEGVLFKLIQSENVAATIFYLKCHGKPRGYLERQVTQHEFAGVKEISGRVIFGWEQADDPNAPGAVQLDDNDDNDPAADAP